MKYIWRNCNKGRLSLPGILVLSLLLAGFILAAEAAISTSKAEASGTQSLGDLNIGDKVVDPSWEWEHRTGRDYSGTGEAKPVTWIVVAKNHYGAGSGVTLLTEEVIGQYAFDNSTDRGSSYGSSNWGDSGTTSATRGLRKFLNGSSYIGDDGNNYNPSFYDSMSAVFKGAIIITTVPNKNWEGNPYYTDDRVFIPSSTELGDTVYNDTYEIGVSYEYFVGATETDRIAKLGENIFWYWTRSPDSRYSERLQCVYLPGSNLPGGFGDSYARDDFFGVRPALNLQSGTQVTEIKNADGAYEIYTSAPAPDPDPSPPTPSLTSPAHGQIVPGSSVDLNWAPVEGATHYAVWIYNLTKDELVIFTEPMAETTYTHQGLADNGDIYAWSVVASDGSKGTWGDFATPIAFINGSDKDLLPPTLTSPGHLDTVSGSEVLLEWEAPLGADLYTILVADLQSGQYLPGYDGSQLFSGTSHLVSGLSGEGTTYFWSVSAADSSIPGVFSDYAFPRLFIKEAEIGLPEEYNVTFSEINNLEYWITIYSDANRTQEVISGSSGSIGLYIVGLENGEYWFTANAAITGFSPYEGSFTVSGAAKTIEFEILYWDQTPDFLSIKDGVWLGEDSDIYDPYGWQGIIDLHTRDNIITSEGSPVKENAAIYLLFNYDDVQLSYYIFEDIEITAEGEFYYEGGTLDGAHSIVISGAFIEPDDPDNQVIYGYVSHTQHGVRSMSFNWTAYHEDDMFVLSAGEVEPDRLN